MGLVQTIKKLFAAPPHVVAVSDLEPGEVVIDGAVRLGASKGLSSPIKGQACVAFVYTAVHQTPGRQAGLTTRPLRTAEGFAPFELELTDGRVAAVPRVAGGFTRAQHQELASAGYHNFQAVEEVVPPRAKVRLRGVARRTDDGWTITYRKLELLGKADKGGKGKADKGGQRRR